MPRSLLCIRTESRHGKDKYIPWKHIRYFLPDKPPGIKRCHWIGPCRRAWQGFAVVADERYENLQNRVRSLRKIYPLITEDISKCPKKHCKRFNRVTRQQLRARSSLNIYPEKYFEGIKNTTDMTNNAIEEGYSKNNRITSEAWEKFSARLKKIVGKVFRKRTPLPPRRALANNWKQKTTVWWSLMRNPWNSESERKTERTSGFCRTLIS